MHTRPECLACFRRQADDVSRYTTDDAAVRARIADEVRRITDRADRTVPPVVIGQRVHRRLRELTGVADPYQRVKRQFNQLATGLLPGLRAQVAADPDPLAAAARLAIAANVIDFATSGSLGAAEVLAALRNVLDQPFHLDLAAFRAALADADRVLYLADNAGEIAIDRLLVEQIGPGRVTVAVRGGAVINDATLADAAETGLADVVEVIDNGSDAPGTVLDDCVPAFRARFAAADLVIAKGQGNFETLSGVPAPVFFLFKVKCPVVAEHSGLPEGTHALIAPRR